MSLILYGGSEASRLYHGDFVVRSWFHWPDGTPGEHDTSPLPYEDCLAWLAAAPHTPLIASDGAHLHQVRVERGLGFGGSGLSSGGSILSAHGPY